MNQRHPEKKTITYYESEEIKGILDTLAKATRSNRSAIIRKATTALVEAKKDNPELDLTANLIRELNEDAEPSFSQKAKKALLSESKMVQVNYAEWRGTQRQLEELAKYGHAKAACLIRQATFCFAYRLENQKILEGLCD